MILVLMTNKYHITWYWCQNKRDNIVGKKSKKFGQGPPPILFGQCPKKIDFSSVRCSLIAIKDTQISGSAFLAFLHSLMTSFTTLCLSLSSFSSTIISMTTIAPTTYIYCRQHDHKHHLQHSLQPLCPHLASPFQLALPSKWPPYQHTHWHSHPPPCLPYSSPPSSHRPTPTWLPLAIWLYLSICITL